jgi:hypothetical protein
MIDARVSPARHDGKGSVLFSTEQEAVKIMSDTATMD